MTRIASHLWFAEGARDAVEFYTSVTPDSAIGRSTDIPAESPAGPPGSVEIIEFTLGDQRFVAMQAGPLDPFNHAFSIAVLLDSQAEVDRIWSAFLDNGGAAEQCGWLRDRWGLCWQIVPRGLSDMISSPDRDAAQRATQAMLTMIKLDLPAIEKAFRGQT